MPKLRSKTPIKEALPILLSRRRPPLTMNQLGKLVGISAAHISRSCSPKHPYVTFSGEATARIAAFFSLPEDYFPEFRVQWLIEVLREDLQLADELYDLAHRRLAERRRAEETLGEAA
jgi:hypothetical protein